MNAVDLGILVVLALSTLFGLMRGFIGTLLSLACWVAAFWIASTFGHQVAGLYAGWLHQPEVLQAAGYLTCFVGVLIVGAIVGWFVRRLIRYSRLGPGDTLLGGALGLARGLLLVTFAVFVMGFTPLPRDATWWRQSMLLPAFADGAAWVARSLPPGVTHYLEVGGRNLPSVSSVPISAVQQLQPHVQHPAAPASGR